ncbi:Hypothetical predicted protein [Pelobates cultripes]|uniref:Uncharacterized protein n=1 Tax=Pelobates cultripes TaxID=61616 RepID=A0AAD1R3L6_PELCU|nr:Hypothetical predicted protein [Pelobates cultripes]
MPRMRPVILECRETHERRACVLKPTNAGHASGNPRTPRMRSRNPRTPQEEQTDALNLRTLG